MQTITSALNVGANEIQTISTTAEHRDEVQTVHTRATAAFEEQEVRTVVDAGQSLGGTFTLTLDTTSYGGTAETTAEIPYSGLEDDVRQAILNLQNVDLDAGGVTVV